MELNMVTHSVLLRACIGREAGRKYLHSEKTALGRRIDAMGRRIDRLVYQLYGLGDEEIHTAEEATGS